MTRNGKNQKLFLAAFFVLLFLPLAAMLLGFSPSLPLEENRTLSAPLRDEDMADPAEYMAEARLWFQDHYGFREFLIRLKAQVDYTLFNYSDRIYIGKEGWLYFRSVIDKEEPAVEAITDAQMDQIIANFAALRDRLAQRGVKLVVMTNQLKYKFYHEYLPDNGAQARGFHRFDDFRARMEKLDGVIFIDTTPRLLELKKSQQIFYKTDFHWTIPAAFDAAQHLVDVLAAQEGMRAIWRHEVHVVDGDYSGGQAKFIPLFHPMHETAPFVQQTWEPLPLRYAQGAPFESVTTQNPHDGLLPPTVEYGDSFSEGLFASGLRDYFTRYAFARIHHCQFADVVQAMPADTKYLVIQFIDVTLPLFIDPDFKDTNDTAVK